MLWLRGTGYASPHPTVAIVMPQAGWCLYVFLLIHLPEQAVRKTVSMVLDNDLDGDIDCDDTDRAGEPLCNSCDLEMQMAMMIFPVVVQTVTILMQASTRGHRDL